MNPLAVIHCIEQGAIAREDQASIEPDRTRWDGYCLKPLTAVTPPTARCSLALNQVATRLDHEAARQDADGTWQPT